MCAAEDAARTQLPGTSDIVRLMVQGQRSAFGVDPAMKLNLLLTGDGGASCISRELAPSTRTLGGWS